MIKAASFIGLAVALAISSSAALAEVGDFDRLGHHWLGTCDPHPVAHAKRARLEQ